MSTFRNTLSSEGPWLVNDYRSRVDRVNEDFQRTANRCEVFRRTTSLTSLATTSYAVARITEPPAGRGARGGQRRAWGRVPADLYAPAASVRVREIAVGDRRQFHQSRNRAGSAHRQYR